MDRCDHRDAHGFKQAEGTLDVGERIEHGRPTLGVCFVHLDRAAEGLQRHARGEMLARAGDHQSACRCRGVQVFEHRVQLFPERWVHGVHRLRTIEHQVGDVMVNREGKAAEFVHGRLPEVFRCQLAHCRAGQWDCLSLV